MDDEQIYYAARNYVSGFLQKITFNDFLPKLLGQAYNQIIGEYRGYNPNIDPSVSI